MVGVRMSSKIFTSLSLKGWVCINLPKDDASSYSTCNELKQKSWKLTLRQDAGEKWVISNTRTAILRLMCKLSPQRIACP
jgi:hypothetical protein